MKCFVLAFLLFASGAQALSLKIVDRSNLTTSQIQKLEQAISITNQVISGPEFRERVLNFKYQGQTQFVQNNGLTNAQILEQLLAGAEVFPKKTQPDGIANLSVMIYYPPWYKLASSAVAFTSTSDPYLHIYNRYFNGSDLSELSATLMHEWTHKMGFDHDFNSTARRPYSVPYGIGTIVSEIVAAYLKK